MNEEQLTRFEFFVRSHLRHNKVKEIITGVVSTSSSNFSPSIVNEEIVIAVSGVAKLFIGELVETGLRNKEL
jgi:hypothetical protein